MARKLILTCAALLALALTGCDPEIEGGDDAGSGSPDAGTQGAVCTEPTQIACEDQLYQTLSMHDLISTGDATTTESGGVFTSIIDATAGGMSTAPSQPYLYLKFTDSGLEKLDITDDDALQSMEWHLMAKRFVVLLNGGDAGPSCVSAAQVSGDFDAVSAAPAASTLALEEFFTDACEYVADSRYASGGFDSPDSVLKEWWEFGNCVSTSGQVFVLRLADGRFVKIVFDAYYETGQEDCNSMGVMGTGSGMLTVRWAWL